MLYLIKICAFEINKNKKIKDLHAVGFEPTSHIATVELESTPLDHSGKRAYVNLNICLDKPYRVLNFFFLFFYDLYQGWYISYMLLL